VVLEDNLLKNKVNKIKGTELLQPLFFTVLITSGTLEWPFLILGMVPVQPELKNSPEYTQGHHPK
jgi:hypothetical protein